MPTTPEDHSCFHVSRDCADCAGCEVVTEGDGEALDTPFDWSKEDDGSCICLVAGSKDAKISKHGPGMPKNTIRLTDGDDCAVITGDYNYLYAPFPRPTRSFACGDP